MKTKAKEKKEIERKLIIKGHDKNIFVKFWNFCWGIYYKNTELWNYIIVGLLTTIVYILIKNLLLINVFDKNNFLETQYAVFISWLGAVLFAYYPNRKYVFNSKSKKYFKEFSLFITGRLGTYLLDALITWVFQSIFGLNGILLIIYNIVDQIVVMVGNYFISKIFVFNKK